MAHSKDVDFAKDSNFLNLVRFWSNLFQFCQDIFGNSSQKL